MAKAPKVRRVQKKDDRVRPSVFTRLKVDEQFRGYALFEPDPELSDNPGFFEYFSHWDQEARTYVPCAGEQCPFCLANDNPATQALTLWYFPDNDANDRLKVFTMNVSTVRDISDIAEEDDGIIGKKFRIKRLTEKGEYRIRTLTEDKPLTKTEIKKLLKGAPDLEDIIERQLKKQWERMKAMDAFDDDSDDDDDDDDDTIEEEEEETKAKKGKSKSEKKSKAKDEEEDEDDDEDEDEEEEENDDDDDDSDDDDESEDDEDDDEDEEEEEDDDDDDSEEEDEEESEMKSAKLTVNKADEDNEILKVQDEDGNKFDLWPGEGVKVEYEDMKKGTVITVDALKDDEGDWVATSIKVSKAKGGKGKKK